MQLSRIIVQQYNFFLLQFKINAGANYRFACAAPPGAGSAPPDIGGNPSAPRDLVVGQFDFQTTSWRHPPPLDPLLRKEGTPSPVRYGLVLGLDPLPNRR